MKHYFQGMLGGIFLTMCVTIFIGATEPESNLGRYQILPQVNKDAYLLLDTETGEVFFNRLNQDKKKYHWSKEPFITTWHDYMAQ